MSTKAQQFEMAKAILDLEARRDLKGNLRLYLLPSGDGGGSYEVAGICERYHPKEALTLMKMLASERYAEAETYATKHYLDYTHKVSEYTDNPGLEFFLRDTAYNRGVDGAEKILQMALDVRVDGAIGPKTLAALKNADPNDLLKRLRSARELYERTVVKRNEKSKFWAGLVNRWDKALQKAQAFNS